MDRVVEHFLTPDFFFGTLSAFRTMSFLATFVIALMLTYIYRQYYLEQSQKPGEYNNSVVINTEKKAK